MRLASLLFAFAVVAGCNSGDPVKNVPAEQSVVGTWNLTTYNGGAIPYTGTANANGSVNKVTSGTITLDAGKTYLLDIKIENTLGTTVTPQDFSEVGSYAPAASGGLVFKPNDISGGTSGQPFATVPVTVSGNTLSFTQEGKLLTFTKR